MHAYDVVNNMKLSTPTPAKRAWNANKLVKDRPRIDDSTSNDDNRYAKRGREREKEREREGGERARVCVYLRKCV